MRRLAEILRCPFYGEKRYMDTARILLPRGIQFSKQEKQKICSNADI
jgi:hypothetical protein